MSQGEVTAHFFCAPQAFGRGRGTGGTWSLAASSCQMNHCSACFGQIKTAWLQVVWRLNRQACKSCSTCACRWAAWHVVLKTSWAIADCAAQPLQATRLSLFHFLWGKKAEYLWESKHLHWTRISEPSLSCRPWTCRLIENKTNMFFPNTKYRYACMHKCMLY